MNVSAQKGRELQTTIYKIKTLVVKLCVLSLAFVLSII